MLGKLAYRNTKRNIKDYLIYLITVTASFSLIFAFNLVASSDEIVKLCSSMDAFKNSLKKLPERKRNTLLMYYFLEMTESEIANLQKITQSGVFRNRHHALETMKKILKEKQ